MFVSEKRAHTAYVTKRRLLVLEEQLRTVYRQSWWTRWWRSPASSRFSGMVADYGYQVILLITRWICWVCVIAGKERRKILTSCFGCSGDDMANTQEEGIRQAFKSWLNLLRTCITNLSVDIGKAWDILKESLKTFEHEIFTNLSTGLNKTVPCQPASRLAAKEDILNILLTRHILRDVPRRLPQDVPRRLLQHVQRQLLPLHASTDRFDSISFFAL